MRREEALSHRRRCGACGEETTGEIIAYERGPHFAKIVCGACGHYWDNVAKPDGDATKYRRPKSHLDLVAKHGAGACEMCLRLEGDLRKPSHLVAHHVREFQDGGVPDRENIWIVCDRCHALIHWTRSALGTEASQDDPH